MYWTRIEALSKNFQFKFKTRKHLELGNRVWWELALDMPANACYFEMNDARNDWRPKVSFTVSKYVVTFPVSACHCPMPLDICVGARAWLIYVTQPRWNTRHFFFGFRSKKIVECRVRPFSAQCRFFWQGDVLWIMAATSRCNWRSCSVLHRVSIFYPSIVPV